MRHQSRQRILALPHLKPHLKLLRSGRFTLSCVAEIVVIFQVSEAHVMRKKNRWFLLMSLISVSLLVSVFTIVQAQSPAAKATKWSDAATWPNRKVPVAGDKE